MHIVDGALTTEVTMVRAGLALAGIALGLRSLDLEKIPTAGASGRRAGVGAPRYRIGLLSGDAIEGEIGLSNGAMAPDTLVEVFNDAGAKIGEARTDADGFFTFTPTEPVALVFRANLGRGMWRRFAWRWTSCR